MQVIRNINDSFLIGLRKFLQSSKVLLMPTDTVFALACRYNDIKAQEKIFQIKKRPIEKKLPILLASINQMQEILQDEICLLAQRLIAKFCPGPFTIILHNKKNSYAFRIPANNILLKILSHTGALSATSCNISGENPIENIQDILSFDLLADMALDFKIKMSQQASSIVEVINNEEYHIIREGSILSSTIIDFIENEDR